MLTVGSATMRSAVRLLGFAWPLDLTPASLLKIRSEMFAMHGAADNATECEEHAFRLSATSTSTSSTM